MIALINTNYIKYDDQYEIVKLFAKDGVVGGDEKKFWFESDFSEAEIISGCNQQGLDIIIIPFNESNFIE